MATSELRNRKASRKERRARLSLSRSCPDKGYLADSSTPTASWGGVMPSPLGPCLSWSPLLCRPASGVGEQQQDRYFSPVRKPTMIFEHCREHLWHPDTALNLFPSYPSPLASSPYCSDLRVAAGLALGLVSAIQKATSAQLRSIASGDLNPRALASTEP